MFLLRTNLRQACSVLRTSMHCARNLFVEENKKVYNCVLLPQWVCAVPLVSGLPGSGGAAFPGGIVEVLGSM